MYKRQRQYSCTHKLFLENGYEVKEVFRRVVADVIYLIWRDRKTVLTILLLRSVLHDTHNTFYDIIYKSEVALAVAIVEYLDGLAFNKFVGETEVSHIWTTSWTIYGKETQASRRNVVEFAIGMSHKLIALLCGCIKRHWVVYLIISRIRNLLVAAIYRR